jgi:hypothetical protein
MTVEPKLTQKTVASWCKRKNFANFRILFSKCLFSFETLNLYWVSREFEDVDQGEISWGFNLAQNTYPGHVFVLKNKKGKFWPGLASHIFFDIYILF